MASVDELKNAGNAAFKEGRYEEAARHFSGAIAIDGNNAILFSNRSGAAASLGKFDEALSDADKAMALRPDWGKVYSRRAAALYGLGRYTESVATYRKGLEIEPGNAQMTQAAADVTATLSEGKNLYEAAAAALLPKMQSILRAGVHPDGFVAEDGSTALMASARSGNAEAVALLLRHGALPSRKNRAGETAAALARKGQHESVLKVLPPEEKTPFGASSFFAAAKEFASSAASSAREMAEKAKQKNRETAATEGMGEESEAVLRKREERRKREEEQRAVEATAAKRKAAEAAMLRAAEEEDLRLLEEEDLKLAILRSKEAAELKHAGNDAFKASHLPDAVRLYTQVLLLEHRISEAMRDFGKEVYPVMASADSAMQTACFLAAKERIDPLQHELDLKLQAIGELRDQASGSASSASARQPTETTRESASARQSTETTRESDAAVLAFDPFPSTASATPAPTSTRHQPRPPPPPAYMGSSSAPPSSLVLPDWAEAFIEKDAASIEQATDGMHAVVLEAEPDGAATHAEAEMSAAGAQLDSMMSEQPPAWSGTHNLNG